MTSKKAPAVPLRKQVEVIRTPNNDGLDHDVDSYVATFLHEFSQIPPLEKIDLMTPEGARSALSSLEKTRSMLDAKMKNVKALKRLLGDGGSDIPQ